MEINLKNKIEKIDQMTLSCLLAEYQQLYEHNRHDNNIGSVYQSILAVTSFFILVYSIESDAEIDGLLIYYAITSIFLYICYLLYFENLRIIIEARFERIATIEDFLSDGVHNLKMDFLSNFEQRVTEQRNKNLFESRGLFQFFSKIAIFLSGVLSQGFFRIGFLFLLITLWSVRMLHGVT